MAVETKITQDIQWVEGRVGDVRLKTGGNSWMLETKALNEHPGQPEKIMYLKTQDYRTACAAASRLNQAIQGMKLLQRQAAEAKWRITELMVKLGQEEDDAE